MSIKYGWNFSLKRTHQSHFKYGVTWLLVISRGWNHCDRVVIFLHGGCLQLIILALLLWARIYTRFHIELRTQNVNRNCWIRSYCYSAVSGIAQFNSTPVSLNWDRWNVTLCEQVWQHNPNSPKCKATNLKIPLQHYGGVPAVLIYKHEI